MSDTDGSDDEPVDESLFAFSNEQLVSILSQPAAVQAASRELDTNADKVLLESGTQDQPLAILHLDQQHQKQQVFEDQKGTFQHEENSTNHAGRNRYFTTKSKKSACSFCGGTDHWIRNCPHSHPPCMFCGQSHDVSSCKRGYLAFGRLTPSAPFCLTFFLQFPGKYALNAETWVM